MKKLSLILLLLAAGASFAGGLKPAAPVPAVGGIEFVTAPVSTNSSGLAAQMSFTTTHFYLCVGTNNWKRSLLAGW